MGRIKHDAIIVTDCDIDLLSRAKTKALDIFSKHFPDDEAYLVSTIIASVSNGYYSFFIAPDGSKEGWGTSDNGDSARAEFIEWLETISVDYAAVTFGGDDNDKYVK